MSFGLVSSWQQTKEEVSEELKPAHFYPPGYQKSRVSRVMEAKVTVFTIFYE